MSAERIIFWLFASIFVIGGSLFTITRRNSVSAVVALVGTFFGLAAVYTLLAAHFLAVIQVLVYAGAIMTLFVFVVMVLNREEVDPWARRGFVTRLVGIVCGVAGMAWVGAFLANWTGPDDKAGLPPPEWGGVASVGEVLFRDYLFPFEAVSVLLLIAVTAAVIVARIPWRKPAALEDEPAASDEGAHHP